MSSPSIVFATCSKRETLTPSDALLPPALARLGVVATSAPWDAVSPSEGDGSLICLRSTWDYHLRIEEFRTWVGTFLATPWRLWNPPELVLWNMDKSYLRDLADRGIPMPPTRWFNPGEIPSLPDLFRETDWDHLVLKPRVSATAHETHLLPARQDTHEVDWTPYHETGAITQSFAPEIAFGEISLIYLDGGFSHAVRKTPATGEFRVQNEFGGTIAVEPPSHAMRALGDMVLATISSGWMYARVDAIETSNGPLLMELEMIEPELFLDLVPGAADAFATGLVRAIEVSGG